MAGNINGPSNTHSSVIETLKQQSVQPTRANEPAARPAPTTSNTNDQVVLTESAKKLRALEQQLAGLPAVDNERVNEVRKAIQAGEFKIDPMRVAEKMISFESQINEKLD
jgi:negative regulator of flagellin synthesis FlgM